MSRLSRLLKRLGARRNSPHSSPRHSAVCSTAPAILIKNTPTLVGAELVRSFGSGDTKAYALQGVSAEMYPGELNLLMGPSGSGKSTLLAVLSGLLRPDSGAVGAMGRDVWSMSEDAMERFRLRHCSYIFQGYNLFPALTAREQLEIVLRWGEGVSLREAKLRADRVLGQLGMTNKAHLRPAELSGGEKQRVAIGRALVKNPSFVFADEPTAALDWENGRQVLKLLTDTARDHGAMVLVVTHDPRLTPYADRVFELADGKMQHEADAKNLTAQKAHRDVSDHTPIPPTKRSGPRSPFNPHRPAFVTT